MPAKGPVSVLWQIIFVVFIPILDLWAFYRIKKLKKYLLYICVPQLVIAVIIVGFILNMAFEENSLEKLEALSNDLENENVVFIISSIVLELGFTGFSIYLIVTWSESWNKLFLEPQN